MKAISIQQPFAWLIVNGHKDIENRDWNTSYRGFVLIHAGKRIDTSLLSTNGYINQNYSFAPHWEQVLPVMPDREQDYECGGIVGYATLTEVVTTSDSPWFRGKYGFVLTQRHTVPFIPLRGQPLLFDVPPEIEAQINEIREQRFWESEMAEQYQIAKEWEKYRLEGDETPPWKVR